MPVCDHHASLFARKGVIQTGSTLHLCYLYTIITIRGADGVFVCRLIGQFERKDL